MCELHHIRALNALNLLYQSFSQTYLLLLKKIVQVKFNGQLYFIKPMNIMGHRVKDMLKADAWQLLRTFAEILHIGPSIWI